MTPGDARASFPGTAGCSYLDTANFGLVAEPVRSAVCALAGSLTARAAEGATERYLSLEAHGERARQALGRLVGADGRDIALVESSSHGLQIAAAAIPLRHGDEVVFGAWDFIGIPLAWRRRAARGEIVLREVPCSDPARLTDALVGAIGPRTRVVCTAAVTEAIGARVDLVAIAAAGRSRDVWLVADVMQAAGVARLDLARSGVDFAASGGHKWLGCPFGAGFLYVRPDRLSSLDPSHAGYLSLETPPEGWDAYLGSPVAPSPLAMAQRGTARRLEIGGTPNFAGWLALAESCALLNAVGVDAIDAHVRALVSRLAEGLETRGFGVVTPAAPAGAGIVCFTLGDPAREASLVRALRDLRIDVSRRYNRTHGGIRVSVHVYNDASDVDALLAALHQVGGPP